jgi:hypothetical protein
MLPEPVVDMAHAIHVEGVQAYLLLQWRSPASVWDGHRARQNQINTGLRPAIRSKFQFVIPPFVISKACTLDYTGPTDAAEECYRAA